MRRKRRWRKVLYFGIGLLGAYGVGCYYLAAKYVRPGVSNVGPPPTGFLPAVGINAWTSDLSHAKAVFVLVHGYGGNQSRWADTGNALTSKGFGVVIPALPGHDSRTEETCGFAIKESQVVLDTAAWIREHAGEDTEIVLVGISMGGAACWLASERDPKIHAVASEGAFARLEPATKRWFNAKVPGASTFLAPVIWFAKGMSGVDPATVNPVDAAAKWKGRPALVIHGDQDQLFATFDAEALAEASGADLWIVKGATHAQCCNVDLKAYVDRLVKLAE
jgi:pimeloyl-ACP methyl ester carboxylesterase